MLAAFYLHYCYRSELTQDINMRVTRPESAKVKIATLQNYPF